MPRGWAVVAMAGCLWLAASLASQAQGPAPQPSIFNLPEPPRPGAPVPQTNGLRVEIDARACSGVGYSPVKVTVHVPGPSPARRDMTFTLGEMSYSRNEPPVVVRGEIELPEGTSSATKFIHLPRFINNSRLNFEFWDEGEFLPALSSTLSLTHFAGNRQPHYGPNPLRAFSLEILLPINRNVQPTYGESSPAFATIYRASGRDNYSPFDLPETAIDYSSWDAVLVSREELQYIIEHRPKCWAALRQWTTAGGNLWIYGLSSDLAELPEVQKLLGLEPATVRTSDVAWHDETMWTKPAAELATEVIDQATTLPQYVSDQKIADKLAKDRAQMTTRLKEPPFAVRAWGLGRVAVLDAPNPLKENAIYWQCLLRLHAGHEGAAERRGVSFTENNREFWNFLIPGVGLAPIGAFMLLISVFVVVIGPANYWLLRRRNRQSLLMFTVPLGAAVVTTALLLYAVVADGFSVRARTRSYTYLDQRQGEAACWSRIAYYAGRQPSGGIEFPLDVEVYPIEPEPAFDDRVTMRQREIEEDVTRRLTKGWLPARTITQLLTVRARPTSARLDIVRPTNGGPLQVINRLGTRVERLIVVDESSAWHTLGPLAADASGVAEPSSRDAARAKTFQHHDMDLAPPDNWTEQGSGIFGVSRRNRYYYGGWNSQPNVEVGKLLEDAIRALQPNPWAPARSYVAVVECSPEFELGLPEARVESAFHVIVGRW